jgi:hypothetical protein
VRAIPRLADHAWYSACINVTYCPNLPIMRIRIVQKPTEDYVDGMDLRHFRVECEYVVGSCLGSVMLAERWAEPVGDDEEPALLVPYKKKITGLQPQFENPGHRTEPLSTAADRPRRKRSPKRKV